MLLIAGMGRTSQGHATAHLELTTNFPLKAFANTLNFNIFATILN